MGLNSFSGNAMKAKHFSEPPEFNQISEMLKSFKATS